MPDAVAGLLSGWRALLNSNAATYARVALINVEREFPVDVRYVLNGPDDPPPPLPRERNPTFFGSFDWHSCVEMHWVLVRLLKIAGDLIPEEEARAVLDEHFTRRAMVAEARFISHPDNLARERPYGWGWGLRLVHELDTWDDSDARGWRDALDPLADALTANFTEWFPKATYPIRHGVHGNSAFGLSLALHHARDAAEEGSPGLLHGINDAADRWFRDDRDYPGAWEPSGNDFLSPALVEAELMSQILPAERFLEWLDRFLPDLSGEQPHALFEPATVSDATDGQIAHLHGLNASRAWCWRRLAESLPQDDPRVGPAVRAAERHAAASLPHVAGDHYMVEHWLAAYAVLMLS